MTDAKKPLGNNPKDLLGMKKVSLSLVPAASTIYQALAMMDGAKKYDPFNWRSNKVIASIYIDACKRHLDAWFDSHEEVAEDSQVPHLGHALACIGILVDAIETGNLVDNRPVAGPAARLHKKYAQAIAAASQVNPAAPSQVNPAPTCGCGKCAILAEELRKEVV